MASLTEAQLLTLTQVGLEARGLGLGIWVRGEKIWLQRQKEPGRERSAASHPCTGQAWSLGFGTWGLG